MIRSRHSARRATTYRRLNKQIERLQRGTVSHGGEADNINTTTQYTKVGYEEAKRWMELKLANMKSGIPAPEINRVAGEWSEEVNILNIDHRIVEIEAAQIAKRWHAYHVPQLGWVNKEKPAGVFRICGTQLGGASSRDVRDRKITQIERLVDDYDLDVVTCLEVGVNWAALPSSKRLASWFRAGYKCTSFASHNTYDGLPGNHQQGGCGMIAFGEIQQYIRRSVCDFRHLGRWCSWLVYATPTHRFRIVAAYNVGKSKPQGLKTIYQQHLKYIQEQGLDTNPCRMMHVDIVAMM